MSSAIAAAFVVITVGLLVFLVLLFEARTARRWAHRLELELRLHPGRPR